jgi:hypothetical protein
VIEADYRAAAETALSCDPDADEPQYTTVLEVGLPCACPAALNPLQTEVIATMQVLRDEHTAADCLEYRDLACDECPEVVPGPCSLEGTCTQYHSSPE